MANFRAGMLQVLGAGMAGAGAGYSSFVDEQSKFDKQIKLDASRGKRDKDLAKFTSGLRREEAVGAEARGLETFKEQQKFITAETGERVDIKFEAGEERRMALIAKLPPAQQAAASLASIGKQIGFDPTKETGLSKKDWTQRYVSMYEQNLRAIKDSAEGAEMSPGQLTEAASMETQRGMTEMMAQMTPKAAALGEGTRIDQIVSMIRDAGGDPLETLEASKDTLQPGEYEKVKALLGGAPTVMEPGEPTFRGAMGAERMLTPRREKRKVEQFEQVMDEGGMLSMGARRTY